MKATLTQTSITKALYTRFEINVIQFWKWNVLKIDQIDISRVFIVNCLGHQDARLECQTSFKPQNIRRIYPIQTT